MATRIKVRGTGGGVSGWVPIKGRCPACGRQATFERFNVDDISVGNHILGHRRCPNDACQAHLFFISEGAKLLATFPAERIPFEKALIPDKVASAFEEAITCHAEECFIAAAVMIRRTFEEVCHERDATGDSLRERIRSLQEKIVIPKELFEGMDELRLLGNDAAHVESREYDKIGKEEVEVGIEFAKEILKAVYQYEHLLSRLRGLKKEKDPPASP